MEVTMISYDFFLALNQTLTKAQLSQLQACLISFGIFLDLSWHNDIPHMTISIPEDILEAATARNEGHPDEGGKDNSPQKMSAAPARRGRPVVLPKNDLTLGCVHQMRDMGVPAGTIAKEIGVSKRTFYRRLEQIAGKSISEDTPFSKWI